MKLEEIKKLSDEDLSFELGVLAYGLKVAEKGKTAGKAAFKEIKGDTPEVYLKQDFFLYLYSLDFLAKVEKIVIEKFGFQQYGFSLRTVFYLIGDTIKDYEIALLATATARQRAEACYLALQNSDK